MKKILLLALFILCLLIINQKLNAIDCHFEWLKTEIEVPLGANIGDYEDLYEVKFYIGEEESFDFYVGKERNYTTFSTVLTYIPGDYIVTYCAYNEDYGIYSYQDITFKVYDNISPKIKGPDWFELPFGKSFNYTDQYIITDNYDTEVTVSVDDRYVSYNVLGVYPVEITATDNSGNQTSKKIMVSIVDNEKPMIKVLKDIVYNYGSKLAVEEFFSITDNYDPKPKVEVIESTNTNLGLSQIKLKVTDFSGNSVEQSFRCLVVDSEGPKIYLTKKSDALDIAKIEDVEELLNSYLLAVTDNYTPSNRLQIEITSDIDISNVGSYIVTYKSTDENGNSSFETLYLELSETVGPTIQSSDSYRFDVGTKDVDLLSLVEVYDEYDSDVSDKIEVVNSNVDFDTPGKYRIVYRAYNSSGNYSLREVEVEVVGATGQVINNNSNNQGELKITDKKIGLYVMMGLETVVILGLLFFLIKRKKTRR